MPRRVPELAYAAVLLCLALAASAAAAVEVDRLEVSKHGTRYRVDMQVRLDVPAESAYAVFTDYANLPRINPAVKQVQALEGAAHGAQRLRTDVQVCFSFYCRKLVQVQDMQRSPAPPGGHLRAEVLPGPSDVRYGRADWHIRDCLPQAPACLDFTAELEPKFWIPPLIGPWIMERKLRQEAVQTSQGIERLARGLAP